MTDSDATTPATKPAETGDENSQHRPVSKDIRPGPGARTDPTVSETPRNGAPRVPASNDGRPPFRPANTDGRPPFRPANADGRPPFRPANGDGRPPFRPANTDGRPPFRPVNTDGRPPFRPADRDGRPPFRDPRSNGETGSRPAPPTRDGYNGQPRPPFRPSPSPSGPRQWQRDSREDSGFHDRPQQQGPRPYTGAPRPPQYGPRIEKPAFPGTDDKAGKTPRRMKTAKSSQRGGARGQRPWDEPRRRQSSRPTGESRRENSRNVVFDDDDL